MASSKRNLAIELAVTGAITIPSSDDPRGAVHPIRTTIYAGAVDVIIHKEMIGNDAVLERHHAEVRFALERLQKDAENISSISALIARFLRMGGAGVSGFSLVASGVEVFVLEQIILTGAVFMPLALIGGTGALIGLSAGPLARRFLPQRLRRVGGKWVSQLAQRGGQALRKPEFDPSAYFGTEIADEDELQRRNV